MGAGKADALDPFHSGHGSQQIGEKRTCPGGICARPFVARQVAVGAPVIRGARRQRQVPAVGVDVLPQQRHLDGAPGRQLLDFAHQFRKGTAYLAAPDRRDDAKGALVVATHLDGDPSCEGELAPHRQRRGELTGRSRGRFEDFHQRALLPCPFQQGGGMAHIVGAEHGVDPGSPLQHLVPVLLGQAAAHGDLQARSLLLQGP